MKALQIEARESGNNELLRLAGIKRIHPGWYTVKYSGVRLDSSTIAHAARNPKGGIKEVI